MRHVLTALLFVCTGIIVLFLLPSKRQLKTEENQASLPVEIIKNDIRDVTPNNALPGPKIFGKLATRLPDKIVPKQKNDRPRKRKYSNLIVTSAGFLSAKDITLQIRHIDPLKLADVCQIAEAKSWPCGRFARTALRQLILKHAIECDPAVDSIDPDLDNTALISPAVVKCQIGGRDIGKWLVRQGWAKSNDGTYAHEMAIAKQQHQGMWRITLP